MKYTKLGTTDIEVSRICTGGMSFGKVREGGHQWLLNEEESTAMLGHAFDIGVNFIDTANTYGRGSSEEYIGKAIRRLGIPRDQIVIATKVFFNLTTKEHLTGKAILAEVEGSLERLGTDYIDLYQIHRFDYDTPIEETMEALDSLVKAGKVRAVGCSAMYGYQLYNMQLTALQHGWTPFATMQNHYNLLYREDEHEVIPVCEQFNMSLIPFSPLAGGHLSRRSWDGETKRAVTDRVSAQKYDRAKEADIAIVKRVAEIADRYGVSMSQTALAWLYAKGAASPIVGATKISHFDDAAKAVDLCLSKEDIAYLEELYVPHEIVGQITHSGKLY